MNRREFFKKAGPLSVVPLCIPIIAKATAGTSDKIECGEKIASGMEYMPSIYIIDDHAMNAFATGRDPKKAAVAVTSGLLQNLNRDELQGVIGHEMAHIKNRDVLLMTMCGVLLGTIVMISYYMMHMLFWGGISGGRRGGGGERQPAGN